MLHTPLPSVKEWATALNLKRRGREYVGPCPGCGGQDRFHVKPVPQGALVGCRGCLDGQPKNLRNRRFGELLRTTWPERYRRSSFCSPPPRQKAAPAPKPKQAPAPSPLPQRLWAASVPADATLARQYLANRFAWPPPGIGPDLPADVRWLAKERAPQPDPAAKWFCLPPTCAGAIFFAWRSVSGALQAVSLESLQMDGSRPEQRWRRTFGSRKGSTFTAHGATGGLLRLCEGEVDALALAIQVRAGVVRAVGGTAGFTMAAVSDSESRDVVLHADADGPGRAAAAALQAEILAAHNSARACRMDWQISSDPADDLAMRLSEDAAVREYDGGQCRGEAELGAWREILETTA